MPAPFIILFQVGMGFLMHSSHLRTVLFQVALWGRL